MITAGTIKPNIELRLSRLPDNAIGMDFLRHVAAGIATEDMRPVTASELATSYAALAAVDVSDPENQRIVGFARQVQRDRLATSTRELYVVELGSVWVDPQQRGKGIGRTLITNSTEYMRHENFIPIAVCNQYSRDHFETAGYTPIGCMPTTAEGNARVVELYEDHADYSVREQWAQGLRDDVIAGIQKLPRFSEMKLIK